MFNEKILAKCNELAGSADRVIPPSRKKILDDIALTLHSEIKERNEVSVVYLCTHNSRRSHFAQVWGHIASVMYNFPEVIAYSGGTVATACHPNTISALKHIGFEVKCDNPEAENPLYRVYYNEEDYVECYSKANTDDSVPQSDFIAIMTCSDSDDNCPLVPGAKIRYSTTFDDPGEFDAADDAIDHYVERSLQIGTEAIYTFQKMFLMG